MQMSVSTPGCLKCESPPIPEEMSFFYHLTRIRTPNYTWSPGQSKDFDLHIRAYFTGLIFAVKLPAKIRQYCFLLSHPKIILRVNYQYGMLTLLRHKPQCMHVLQKMESDMMRSQSLNKLSHHYFFVTKSEHFLENLILKDAYNMVTWSMCKNTLVIQNYNRCSIVIVIQ